MRKPSNELFNLIKSLSKSEKGPAGDSEDKFNSDI